MSHASRLVFSALLLLLFAACRCGTPCDAVVCPEGQVCVAGACQTDLDGGADRCASDFDCAGLAGRTHCDAASQACVACLFAAHCADPVAQICAADTRRCVPRPPCIDDSGCADLPAASRCEPQSGACVGCLVDGDCPGSQQGCHPTGFFCAFEPCAVDGDCTDPAEPYCFPPTGLCQACTTDAHCAADEVCRDALCQPRGECVRSSECGPGEVCNTSGLASCDQCAVDLDCRIGGVCRSTWCVAATSCSGDVDCPAPAHCQLATGQCVDCLSAAHCARGQQCNGAGACVAPAACSASAFCLEGDRCAAGSCQSVACADDDAENNDVPYSATPIAPGLTAARVLCPNDWDWYVAAADVGDGVMVELAYDRSAGDPTLLVWAGTGTGPALAGQPTLKASGQQVEIPSLTRSGPLWLGVRGINSEVAYDLTLTVDPNGLCADDGFEPNDGAGLPTAMPVPLGGRSELDAIACFADEDWFSIDLPAGQRLLAEAQPLGGAPAGNLLLSIFVQSAGGGLTLVGGTGANSAVASPAPGDRILLLRVTQIVPGATDYHLLARIRPPRPSNDGCGGAPLLLEGVSVRGSTGGATDDGATACGGIGSPDVVYAFDLATDRQVTLSTTGALDTVLALRSSCSDPATELACHDTPGSLEQLTALLPAGRYTVWVDGFGGAEGSFDLLLTTAPPPPPPVNERCASAIAFDVAAGGGVESGDLSVAVDDGDAGCGRSGGDAYYDLVLGVPASLSLDLLGASELSVSVRATCNDPASEQACAAVALDGAAGRLDLFFLAAGTWTVIVDGGGPAGGAYTLNWALGSPIPPAPNDTCASPEPLVFTAGVAQVSGDTRNARDDLEAACALPGASGGDVVYSFALLNPQAVTATLQPTFDGVLALRAMPCADPASSLACSDRLAPTIFFPELGSGLYYLLVDGYQGASGPFTLEVRLDPPLPPPPNDLCPAATVVDVQAGPQTRSGYTTSGSDTMDPTGTCLPFAQPGADVFYSVDLLAGQTLQATATPEAGHDLSIYLLGACDPAACLAGADASFVSLPETVTTTVTADTTVWVGIDAWSATAEGRFTLDLALQ